MLPASFNAAAAANFHFHESLLRLLNGFSV